MQDLALVIILHLALLQLLGRRLPPSREAEGARGEPRRTAAHPSQESAQRMIERAFPFSCPDAPEDSPYRER
jgi:hypothetical protein